MLLHIQHTLGWFCLFSQRMQSRSKSCRHLPPCISQTLQILAVGASEELSILGKGQGSCHTSHYTQQLEKAFFTVTSHVPAPPAPPHHSTFTPCCISETLKLGLTLCTIAKDTCEAERGVCRGAEGPFLTIYPSLWAASQRH